MKQRVKSCAGLTWKIRRPGLLTALLFLAGLHTASGQETHYETALKNGRQAQEALQEADRLLLGWTARKDPGSALIHPPGGRWTVRGTATRLYPQMVLAAYLTNRPLFNGLLRETLQDEIRLTARLKRLPDDFNLTAGRFLHTRVDTNRILTSAAGYAAEGLAAVTGIIGPDIWADRLQAIVDDLFEQASLQTPYTPSSLPSEDAEVNGHLLRILPRLTGWTGDPIYLEWARQIGDAYCLGILPRNGGLPPRRWNFTADRARDAGLSLDDTGYPILQGLIFLYAVEAAQASDRALIYRPTLARMLDVLYAYARSPEGLFYARIEPDGKGGYAVDRKNRSSAWPHILAASLTFGRASGNATYVRPVHETLKNLPELYTRSRGNRSDRIADTLPTILTLLAHIPPSEDPTALQPALAWADREMAALLQTQPSTSPAPQNERSGGARLHAALAYAWFKTAGIRLDPWREDLICGATVAGDTLYFALQADLPWQGRIAFDTSGDGSRLPLPQGHPFDHGFPKRFGIASNAYYTIRISGAGGSATWSGSLLKAGLPVTLAAGEIHRIQIARATPPPRPMDAAEDSLQAEDPEEQF